jgi:hypothetical protein
VARQCGAPSPPLLDLLALGEVPDWLIRTLVVHSDDAVRRAVARSPGVPISLLEPFRRAGARADLCGYVLQL